MLREEVVPVGSHHVVMEDCRRLSVTGVRQVMRFDEDQVVMDTDQGVLTVEGGGLHVEKLSLDVGEVALGGIAVCLALFGSVNPLETDFVLGFGGVEDGDCISIGHLDHTANEV
jgi:sporulation protein YabP